MHELIDIIDEEGNLTGNIVSKEDIHKFGYWHNTAHIWIIDNYNNILIQKRHSSRSTFPDLWDISVAGHISSKETIRQGAIREVKEELNLNANEADLIPLFVQKNSSAFLNNTYINNEFFNVFLIKKDIKIENLKIQSEEVSEIKFISIEEFLFEITNNLSSFANRNNYYQKSIENIKKYIKFIPI